MDLQQFYSIGYMTEKELNVLNNKIIAAEKKVAVPDPATIYQAYQTGKAIYDLFKKKKGKKDELMSYLKKELTLIKQLLYDVIAKLEELKVFIRQESRENAVNNLESIIRIFNESYNTWWEQSRREDVKREVSEVNIRLKEYNRVAQKHGFAHFHTIWIGVIYELVLLEYFERPKQEVKTILLNHSEYFKEGLQPTINGSIKQAYLLASQNIKTQNDQFPSTQYHNQFSVTNRNCYITYKQTLTISGNLIDGFSFAVSDPVELRRECESPRGGGSDRAGGPRNLLVAKMDIDTNFNAIISNYNSARLNYLNILLPLYKDTIIALENCEFYYKELQQRASALK